MTKFWPKGCRQRSKAAFPSCFFKTSKLCPLPCFLPHPLSCCHSATLLLGFWALAVTQNGEAESWKKPMEEEDSCAYIINPLYCLFWSLVQLLNCVGLFSTPWTAASQASLSIVNCRSLPKPMSIELVMPANHLILCHPLLLLPSIFPSIRVFSNESSLRIRWPKYWSFSFSISPSNEHPGLISFRMD